MKKNHFSIGVMLFALFLLFASRNWAEEFSQTNQGWEIKIPEGEEEFPHVEFTSGALNTWSVKPGETAELVVLFKLEEGYHIYAPESPGPNRPTDFTLDENLDIKVAKIQGEAGHRVEAENGNIYYEGEGKFIVSIEVSPTAKAGIRRLEGDMFYQVCDAFG